MDPSIGKFYWHIHHNELLNVALEPIKDRITYIEESKPPDEVPVRLRLLQEVRGRLPDEMVQAGRKLIETRKAWKAALDAQRAAFIPPYVSAFKHNQRIMQTMVASAECRFATNLWDEVRHRYCDEIEALHAQECANCPWNGETIFPGTPETG